MITQMTVQKLADANPGSFAYVEALDNDSSFGLVVLANGAEPESVRKRFMALRAGVSSLRSTEVIRYPQAVAAIVEVVPAVDPETISGSSRSNEDVSLGDLLVWEDRYYLVLRNNGIEGLTVVCTSSGEITNTADFGPWLCFKSWSLQSAADRAKAHFTRE